MNNQDQSLSNLNKSVVELMHQFDDKFKPEDYIHNSYGYIGTIKICCETSGEPLMHMDAHIRYQRSHEQGKKSHHYCTMTITLDNPNILSTSFRPRSLKVRGLNIDGDIQKLNLKIKEYRSHLSGLLTKELKERAEKKDLVKKNAKQLTIELQKIQTALSDTLTNIGKLSSSAFSLNGEVNVDLLFKCGETLSIFFSNNKFLVNVFNKKHELSTEQLIQLLKIIYKQ